MYRQECLSSDASIDILAIGEKSKVSTSNHLRVSQIARSASSNLKKCELLVNIAQFNDSLSILELGTNLGLASTAFAENGYNIITVEGNSDLFSYSTKKLRDFDNCQSIHSSFLEYLEKCESTFDLILIDGDHSYLATMGLYKNCKKLLNPKGIILIDDIRWSEGMKAAWKEIQTDKSMNYFIDLFMMGIAGNKGHLKSSINKKLIAKKFKPWPYHFFRP